MIDFIIFIIIFAVIGEIIVELDKFISKERMLKHFKKK
jgi:hypothetical protein